MGTVSNKQAKKPFFFVRVTVFLNSRTHSAPKYLYYLLIIMNIILCFTICCLLVATEAQRYRNSGKGRQLVPPNRQEDINLPFRTVDENKASILLDNRIEDVAENEIDVEEEEGFLDSIFGDGAQSRIAERVTDWVGDRAAENPGCVERFVCETYRTGETLNGVPYLLMSLTNAAVSFMLADQFDQSIDVKELIRSAKVGRADGSCHTRKCDFLDNQLRTVGDYLGTFEEFLSQIFNSISESLSFGK